MKAVLRGLHLQQPGTMFALNSDEEDYSAFENFVHPNPKSFRYRGILSLGKEDSKEPGEFFYFQLMTPDSLYDRSGDETMFFAQNLIIALEWDYLALRKCIDNWIVECKGDSWDEVANKLSKLLAREYQGPLHYVY